MGIRREHTLLRCKCALSRPSHPQPERICNFSRTRWDVFPCRCHLRVYSVFSGPCLPSPTLLWGDLLPHSSPSLTLQHSVPLWGAIQRGLMAPYGPDTVSQLIQKKTSAASSSRSFTVILHKPKEAARGVAADRLSVARTDHRDPRLCLDSQWRTSMRKS